MRSQYTFHITGTGHIWLKAPVCFIPKRQQLHKIVQDRSGLAPDHQVTVTHALTYVYTI